MDAGIQGSATEAAARWYLANRSAMLSEAERAQFAAWLRESVVHVREYLAVSCVARDLPAAAAELDMPALLAQLQTAGSNVVALPGAVAPGRADVARSRTGAWFALAASVLLVLGLGAWLALTRAPATQHYVTAHGEQRSWPLADGSVLHLNSDSSLTVQFTRAERRLELQRGQALFGVAHDARRPFRVFAGAAQVVAVGTQFDVYRREDATIVTVVEGRVAVASSSAGKSQPLGAGERLRVGRDAAARVEQVDARAAVAWLQRRIVFEQQTLAEVAAEFNRYRSQPIRIDSAAVRGLRISGVFDAYDQESFLEFLRRLDGVRVRETPDSFRVDAAPVPDSR